MAIRKAASQQAAQQEAQAQASGSGSGTWTGEQRGQEGASARREEVQPPSTGATAGRGCGRGRGRGRGRARGGRGGGGGGGVDAHRLVPHASDAVQVESQPEAPKPLSRNARKKPRQAQAQAQREAETDTPQLARDDVVPLSHPVSTPQPSTKSQNLLPPTIAQQEPHSGQGGGRGRGRGPGRGGRGGVRIVEDDGTPPNPANALRHWHIPKNRGLRGAAVPVPIPAPKDTSKPKREIKPEDTHYGLVLEAANAAVSTLNKLGLKCAIFGSLASKLYGCSRCPKDVDILTFPHATNPLTTAQIKDMIIASNTRFFLKLSKDPRNDYKILWYRRPSPSTSGGARGRKQECKVDILIPGIMNLPNLGARADGVIWLNAKSPIPLPTSMMLYPGPPPHEVDDDGNIIRRCPYPQSAAEIGLGMELNWGPSNNLSFTVLPFPILLLQKLQGWVDHRVALEGYKRRKQAQDAADVKSLLEIGTETGKLTLLSSRYLSMTTTGAVFHDVWNDKTWFPGDFVEVSRKRVRLFCHYFPRTRKVWARLGFETVPREGEVAEELMLARWVVDGPLNPRRVGDEEEDFEGEGEVEGNDIDDDGVESSHKVGEEDVGVSELDRCEEALLFAMSLASTLNI